MNTCPCKSGQDFAACCAPYLNSAATPATPEALMRSRYTAFATNALDYLQASMVEEHREEFHLEDVQRWNRETQWLDLTILDTAMDGDNGEVRFEATFKHKGVTQSLTEHSRFVRRDGHWYYLDGLHETETKRREAPKVGRNDPCPCGSGKKFKKCCA